jgi:CspA family cold shock protein
MDAPQPVSPAGPCVENGPLLDEHRLESFGLIVGWNRPTARLLVSAGIGPGCNDASTIRAHKERSISMQGTIKIFFTEKHFGFIETEAGDFFFHGSQVIGEPPQRGDSVDFLLDDGPRGDLRTKVVRRIE